MSGPGDVIVRSRVDGDLAACVEMAHEVHRRDAYPVHLPRDMYGFLAAPEAVGAWVAEEDGEVVGHVALHTRSSAVVMDRASEATGRPPDRIGVVARLLVAPSCRRGGVGRALLRTAAAAAVDQDRWPVLDVATRYPAAIALYERCGWRAAGQVTAHFPDGTTLEELVYLGPVPASWPAGT